MKRSPRRLGVFGGTFNPIHFGHLRSAEEIAEGLTLDQVLFIPSAQPPHKASTNLAPASHRLAMVRRAVARNPRFRACGIEVERAGRSYSVDTLRQLRRRFGPDTALYFFLGLDAFREIGTWRDFPEIFALADLVVTSRPPDIVPPSVETLPVAVQPHFCYRPRLGWIHRSGHKIHFRSVTPLDISASDIRAHLAHGRSIRYLLPPSVESYLTRHRLYRKLDQIDFEHP